MEDDDDFVASPCDIICERVQAIRNIAADLETIKSAPARKLLSRAAELVLQHMEPPKARVVALIPNTGKSAKEQPL